MKRAYKVEPTVPTGEAARQLKVSAKTVQNWIHAGKLVAVSDEYGTRVYFRVLQSSIDVVLAEREKTPDQVAA